MITYDYGGGLGNQLFQYAQARLVSEYTGFKLCTEPDFSEILTPTDPKPGIAHTHNRVHITENNTTPFLLKYKYEKRHYHLQGYWQNSDYYVPNRDRIVRFFKERAPVDTNTRDIVMHIRLGDYKTFGPFGTVLDPKYYFDCLGAEKFNRLFIVTDAPDDPYVKKFRRHGQLISRGTIAQDFWKITEFSRIIMSNSTFAWWAAFLSNAEKIYVPDCWIRNSIDIPHALTTIASGRCTGTPVSAGFIDYK